VCGSDSRITGFANPAATCFNLFPLADPLQSPYEYSVYEASLAGTLDAFVSQNNTFSDAVMGYLMGGNTSIAWNFPGFPECIVSQTSTRDIHPNPQGTQASLDWVDCAFQAIWSYTCPGTWCDQNTGTGSPLEPLTRQGICRRRCAVSPEYCAPNAPQFDGAPMHLSSIPTWALPLVNTTDYATTPACGDLIQVSTYSITNTGTRGKEKD
jgi:hypothetical protein